MSSLIIHNMLVEEQKISPGIFDKEVECVYMREGFGEGLLEAGELDERVVGLCADLVGSTKMDKFAKRFPKRFIEVGVAEQNMAGVASGLAHMGKIPFIASYAMFSPGRNWEQIRTTICYNNVPVKIVGSHAGVSVGPDGGTHQALEDIAITRVIPRMSVVVSADAEEARKATLAIARTSSPTYLRLVRDSTPVVTTSESPFEIGKANLLWEGEDPSVGIIACGPLVYSALIVAKELARSGISSLVLNNHTIKPMDEGAVLDLAKRTGAIITIEEHQRSGGMGSAVAEYLAGVYPVPIEIMGVNDVFGESGKSDELLKKFKLDVPNIIGGVQKVIKRKG